MIEFKLGMLVLCGVLNAMGGYHWLFCRRYMMPFFIGVAVSVSTVIWWTGFMVLPVMGTLCLGYFGSGFWGRGLWLALQAAMIGLGLLLTHHVAWFFYFPYVLIAGLLAGFLYDLEQLISDFIFGSWLGILLLLVH